MSRALQSVVLAVTFGLGVLVGTFALSTGAAQQPLPPNSATWRYQLSLSHTNTTVYLCDTGTGRAWVRYSPTHDWADLQTPPSQEKK